jgi:hypothetical protein
MGGLVYSGKFTSIPCHWFSASAKTSTIHTDLYARTFANNGYMHIGMHIFCPNSSLKNDPFLRPHIAGSLLEL